MRIFRRYAFSGMKKAGFIVAASVVALQGFVMPVFAAAPQDTYTWVKI